MNMRTKYVGQNVSVAIKALYPMIQNKTRRVREGLLPNITEQDCSDQMDLLPSALLPEHEEAPFAIH